MIKAAIIGATGYAGAELVRILSRHPQVRLTAITSQSYAGQAFWQVYPHLYKYIDLTCEEMDLINIINQSDVIFAALPHGHAMPIVLEAVKQNKKIIDLGADFRIDDPVVYESWYKVTHTAVDLLAEAVYGLPEINRNRIKEARILANPGCYPTSAILGLAPLLARGLIEPESIIIDSKSGVSGAGRSLSLNTHYSEVNESIKAYNIGQHRHTPEIEQEISKIAGQKITLSFTPHLTPMIRGILSTIYAKLKIEALDMDLGQLYRDFYQEEPFVRVLPEGCLPRTKDVSGSNFCDVAVVKDKRTGRAVVVSAIDNLLKGASGQAVQNMNIMFGFAEATGIDDPSLYP
ncbi:N-acetyl-gamma-glutamyl-phosphate reductase [Desulfofarcimen acetoxidans DSM 771]|uniref:N-acetyl-gamma-glutamyl-phosphate reductase n=1 Tax=Desulfofarcimen acetoxidans (strain ATCC 49208 / DSM 771 / KCTC 5769 / VKM B-1644 / 5575) TaxID=485916 RepID=C8W631_DESAS|nr:N-acetyl-gamma-glutamyl-phosphate reductase [Desulfofarcimen acetoxidans]ACV61486.1 N-acetyl-gamma-glutamyl-phosphate reductase [Desulfofarcimen acetoxidans DSM 771]